MASPTLRPVPFLPGFICLAAVCVPLAFSSAPPDPFHAWRWGLLCLCAAFGLGALILSRSFPPPAIPLPARGVLLLAVVFCLLSLFSLGMGADRAEGHWQAAQTLGWTAWLFLAVAAGSRHPAFWIAARRAGVTLALLGSLYAAGEYWGLWNLAGGTLLGPGGLHGNRNLLASFQFLLCPWIVWALLEETGLHQHLAFAAWGMFCYALAITQCRAAWLGAAVFASGALAFALSGGMARAKAFARGRLRVLVFLAAMLPAAFALHAWKKPAADLRMGNLERLTTIADAGFDSNAERLALWHKTWQLIERHPWRGSGAGNWKIALPSVGLAGLHEADMSLVEVRPYNDWLWVTAETGLPGGLCWLGLWAAALAIGIARARREREPAARRGLLLIAAGLLGFGVVSALDFPRERAEHMAWYGLGLAALLTLRGGAGLSAAEISRTAPARDRAAAGALAVLAGGAALFAFARWHDEGLVRKSLEAQAAGDWAGVIASVEKLHPAVCDLNPAASPMAWHEGIARFQIGDRAGAEAAFLRALEAHPWHLHVLHNLGICRLAAGDTAGAIAYLQRALAISPGFSEAAINFSVLSLRTGGYGSARKALDGVALAGRSPKWRAVNDLVVRYERNSP
jgi:O-antigen ligase